MSGREAVGEPGNDGRSRGRLPAPKEGLIAFGHLAVLSTFALAQPLFDLLSNNPEFFAARGSTPGEIVVFALLLVLVPPLVLFAVEVLVGLGGPRARRSVHLGLLGLLATLVFAQALKKLLGAPDAVLIALAFVLGTLAALAYARAQPVRAFMSVLTLAPIVFLVLFLFISPVSRITLAGEAEAKSVGDISRVPIVMIVFDELPSGSLMDAKRRVDPARYPGFAALSQDATWFRGAHTIYDSTTRAVPAIMDGTYPEKEQLPTPADHPNSIFALLGKSHRMNVSEEATSVCPRDLCKDARLDESLVSRLGSMTSDLGLVYAHVVSPPSIEEDLPSVSETWGAFGGSEGGSPGPAPASTAGAGSGDSQPNARANLNGNRRGRFEDWVNAIEPGNRPALNFKHTLLPHVPWQYLPDGSLYRQQADDPIPNLSRQSYQDPAQVDQLQLRHLLQLGFADLELRKVIARLKKIGTYDETLIVVTADHGVALQDGRFNRRLANRSTLDEISPVPLFVKKPDQAEGEVDDSVVETTDVLPTILDVLGADKPEGMDGFSAFSEEVKARDEVKVFARSLEEEIRVPAGEFEAERREVLREKIRVFGEGADGPERIYRVGPNAGLIGRRAASLDAGQASEAKATLVDEDALREVDPAGRVVPSWIVGRISGGGGPKRDIAVSVNGTVRGVGNTFELASGGGEIFAVMVPPGALRGGRNEVEIFEAERGGERLRSMTGP
ncbi:MAG: sulfatase-like hydrolase/transferase [Thermoleophilaceae bacterium]